MNLFIIFLFSHIFITLAFFHHWHCLSLISDLPLDRPFSCNIGDLPLVVWKSDKEYCVALNICKHMGSSLKNAKVTPYGYLQCQYHGFEYSNKDNFGKLQVHEDKLFWSFNPEDKRPPTTPFYNNPQYVHSSIIMDMPCSLSDSAYNSMDIRHPQFVHSGLTGFGSPQPCANVQNYKIFKKRALKGVGLSFDYPSRSLTTLGSNITSNYHMFLYPSFTWSRVSFVKNHLIVSVHMLPIEKKVTRWFVTVCHNYYGNNISKELMKVLALTILSQDFSQLQNQIEDNPLKKSLMFEHLFEDEEILKTMSSYFNSYSYPDIDAAVRICEEFKKR
jgi:phenylpropionate dioxygenase-like ring-hydroxylating dioxygenase large terminal subunit